MEMRHEIRLACVGDWGRQGFWFIGTRATVPFNCLIIVFLAVLSVPLTAYGGDNDPAAQAVKAFRDQYEQRKESLIA
jgi:hypothetical protein